jgi:hypothetical protein
VWDGVAPKPAGEGVGVKPTLDAGSLAPQGDGIAHNLFQGDNSNIQLKVSKSAV